MTPEPQIVPGTASPHAPPPSWDPRRDLYGIVRGVAFLGLIAFLFWLAGDVLLLLFAGILVAIFIHGIASWVSQHTRAAHGLSIAIVLVGLTLLFGVVILTSAPEVANQVTQLGQDLPRAVDNLHQQLGKSHWAKSLMDQLPNSYDLRSPGIGLVKKATGALNTTVLVVARMVVIGFLGLFLAIHPDLYRRGFLRLIPISRRKRVTEILDATGATLRGWLVGKVLSAVAIGVATWTGLQLMGIPLALILSVMAALLSFIPNFGPILAMVPAMLLGLMQGTSVMLYVGLLYLVIQIIETYLLTPWLAHRTANLPPALTIVAQIFLGVLFGGMGVIMAAPVTAAVMVLVRTLYVEDVLGDRAGDIALP
ncbi:MAG TPA: AI-2E family transporter [Candidatus Limnocylindrales bacterium]|nr:AI-2E family transporter [Candidatus Limnocylindrales bacterium]